MNLRHIRIFPFRAVDNPVLSRAYEYGQRESLHYFNVGEVSATQSLWMDNASVYCIVAQDMKNHQVVGGARIHLSHPEIPLPTQKALGHLEPKLWADLGPGDAEGSGFWISRTGFKFKSLGKNIVEAVVVLARHLRVKNIFTFANQYSLPVLIHSGFHPDLRFGNRGNFIYPSKEYVATIVRVNPSAMAGSDANSLVFMDALGHTLLQTVMILEDNVLIKVDFDFRNLNAQFSSNDETRLKRIHPICPLPGLRQDHSIIR